MIAPKQLALLKVLVTYKIVSRAQCAKLGIEKYNSNYAVFCKPLLARKMIGVLDARSYGLGLLYYPTEKGAKVLASHEQLPYSSFNYYKVKPTLSPQTLIHRTYAIDCQIELHLSCITHGLEIDFYERDIETIGSLKKNGTLQRKTRVPIHDGHYLEPDAIFRICTPKGKKLYCFELENATYTKKSFAKILKHISALNLKTPSKKYQHKKAHRVLMVYTDEAVMQAVMLKMKQEVKNISHWFLFKTYTEATNSVILQKSTFQVPTSKDYLHNWRTIQGNSISMY